MLRTGLTIDPFVAQDLDDAVWAKRLCDGRTKVCVYVTNVASKIPKGHSLDERVLEKASSRYRQDSVDHMLPPGLSTDSLSLLPGRKRKALAIEAILDGSGRVESTRLALCSFRSRAQLSYKLASKKIREGHGVLGLLLKAAQRLIRRRRAGGALAVCDLESGWATSEDGSLIRLSTKNAAASYLVVQECMILANSVIASWAAARGIPILYRNHEAKPDASELRSLVEMLEEGNVSDEHIREASAKLRMVAERALYHPTASGHYGLNLPAYVHATSPIRRCADLITQRQLVAYLSGKKIPYSHEELVDIGCRLNQAAEERRAEMERHYREISEDVARKHLHRGSLARLSPKKFERVTAAVVEHERDPEDGYIQEAKTRLVSGSLTRKDVARILTTAVDSPKWMEFKETIVSRLRRTPHVAMSALTIAAQAFVPGILAFNNLEREEDRTHWAQAQLSVTEPDQSVCSTWCPGRTIKQAQQRAALVLLAKLAGTTIPEFFAGPPLDASS